MYAQALSITAVTAAVLTQYIMLYFAATTTTTDMLACDRSYGGFAGGWGNGACLTEEQLWCRAHPNRHADCVTADCRAEEIRLYTNSLAQRNVGDNPFNDGPLKYDCTQTVALAELQQQMVTKAAELGAYSWEVAPCVPEGDPRSGQLQPCHPSVARCRGRFYSPHNTSEGFAPIIDCDRYWQVWRTPYDDAVLWNNTGVTLPIDLSTFGLCGPPIAASVRSCCSNANMWRPGSPNLCQQVTRTSAAIGQRSTLSWTLC